MKKITGANNAMEELLSKSNETQIKDLKKEETNTPISKTTNIGPASPSQVRKVQTSANTKGSAVPQKTNRPVRKKKKMSLWAAIIAELKDIIKNIRIPKKAIVSVFAVLIGVAVVTGAFFLLSNLDFSKETVPDIHYKNIPLSVSEEAKIIPLFSDSDTSDRYTVTIDIFEGDSVVCTTPPATSGRQRITI